MKAIKIQLAQSSRLIETTDYNQFQVIQDNKTKTITQARWETSNGLREIIFLGTCEAILKGGRYIRAQSQEKFCAKLIFDEKVEEVTEAS